MSCRHSQDLFLSSLDAPLTAPEQATLDQHLAQCPPCVGRMRDTIALRQVLGGLGGIETRKQTGPLSEALVQRILTARAAEVASADTRQARKQA